MGGPATTSLDTVACLCHSHDAATIQAPSRPCTTWLQQGCPIQSRQVSAPHASGAQYVSPCQQTCRLPAAGVRHAQMPASKQPKRRARCCALDVDHGRSPTARRAHITRMAHPTPFAPHLLAIDAKRVWTFHTTTNTLTTEWCVVILRLSAEAAMWHLASEQHSL